MKNILNLLYIFLLIVTVSCNQSSENKQMSLASEEDATPTNQVQQDEVSETTIEIERKLIKEGNVDFETNDITTTRKNLFDAVEKFKAYVSSDQEYKSSGSISNTIIIRVPADNFDKLLSDATKGIEKFDRKEINVKDVTEEFLDIQARLKTKKELELRYIELLKEAKNVSDVLEIEREIGKLRSEIESIEGRLNYLQSKISFSTLTLHFYENTPHDSKYGQQFNDGLSNGSNGFVLFFIGLTNFWPFIVIGLALFFGIRAYRRKKTTN